MGWTCSRKDSWKVKRGKVMGSLGVCEGVLIAGWVISGWVDQQGVFGRLT